MDRFGIGMDRFDVGLDRFDVGMDRSGAAFARLSRVTLGSFIFHPVIPLPIMLSCK
ncbi:hypothetical protein [Sporosarcina obsidiansis]|uniref:hypothetical protein n=1 Tax=Sporosarcina obsidiansis TaxID=2660748 RepID=UPI00129BA4B2|nr:hypothetical protein [Sporosarcina obsidiansis]